MKSNTDVKLRLSLYIQGAKNIESGTYSASVNEDKELVKRLEIRIEELKWVLQ